MNIPIKYNDTVNEFTDDLTLQMRLENYIKNHFYPAYTISVLCPIYLLGGAIRDLIYAKKPKDLDFVVIGKENLEFLFQLFDKFNIRHSYNKLGGFKFYYNNIEIDLWVSDDLFSAIQYNVDGLFFDLKNNSLISLTFADFIDNGLKLVNNQKNIENGREKKLIKFEKQFKKDNKCPYDLLFTNRYK